MMRLSKRKSVKDLKISGPVSPLPPLPTSSFEEFPTHDFPTRQTSMSFNSINVPRTAADSSVILITKFDFKAENQHELTVSAGEAVKLIERKGNGWILVKPIGRLSGPGLIPATYVRIVRLNKERSNSNSDEKWLSQSDSFTHTAATQKSSDSLEEIQRQMQSEKTRVGSQDLITSEKMIERPAFRSGSSTNSSIISSPRERDNTKYSSVDTTTTDCSAADGTEHTFFSMQSPYSVPSSPVPPLQADETDPVAVSGLVRNASSYNGRYWYRVDITMSNGKKRYLCRYYQDFYKLHCSLIEQLMKTAKKGEDDQSLIDQLPTLPDPIPRPDLTTLSNILLQRCQGLNVYIFKIVRNKPELDYGDVLSEWVLPRLGDLELGEETQLSNDSIEELLKPIPTNIKTSSQTKPTLTIQTAMTPPLPAPQAPSYFHPSARSASISSTASFQSSLNSPRIWSSPTFSQHPQFRSDRSHSTPTIPEGQELNQEWMSKPTEPLFGDKSKKSRNMSCPTVISCPTEEHGDQSVKVKVYFNGDIFALKFKKGLSDITEIKVSIAKRLECDVDALRLYYKNPVKNYFSPLVDDMDVDTAFEQNKVSVKVHIWDNKI